MNSLEFRSPIVDAIVLEIIKKIRESTILEEKKYRLDSDIVPRFSMKPRIKGEKFVESLKVKIEQIEPPKIKEPTIPRKPLEEIKAPVVQVKQKPVQKAPVPIKAPQKTNPFPNPTTINETRIAGLMKDPLVSMIECLGPDGNLNIISRGTKHQTQIALSAEEIKDILVIFSEESRIPLQEGVFRVSTKYGLVNAVISEEIGTRFIIKKSPPKR